MSKILLVLVILLVTALLLDFFSRKPLPPQPQTKNEVTTVIKTIAVQDSEKSKYLANLEKILKTKEEALNVKEQLVILKQKELAKKEAELQKMALQGK